MKKFTLQNLRTWSTLLTVPTTSMRSSRWSQKLSTHSTTNSPFLPFTPFCADIWKLPTLIELWSNWLATWPSVLFKSIPWSSFFHPLLRQLLCTLRENPLVDILGVPLSWSTPTTTNLTSLNAPKKWRRLSKTRLHSNKPSCENTQVQNSDLSPEWLSNFKETFLDYIYDKLIP